MKRLLSLLALLFLFVVPSLGFSAESLSEGTPRQVGGDQWYVDIVFTCDTDNSFDTLVTTHSYVGYLYAVVVTAGATGATANSDLDIYHTYAGAATSAEMLSTQGDNIVDATGSNFVTLSSEVAIYGQLGIDIENNAVNNATGTIRLFFRIPGSE